MTTTSSRRVRRWVLSAVAVLLAAGLVAGVLTGALPAATRAGLSATGLLVDGGSPTIAPGTLSGPTTAKPRSPATPTSAPRARPTGTPGPPPVLRPVEAGRLPQASRLTAKVDAVNRSGVQGRISGSVVDVGSGRVLYRKNASQAYVPASTLKLLTATAALSALGPDHRFATRVVQADRGKLILVGGGDPYLSATVSARFPHGASLSVLARSTAAKLRKSKQTKVTLGYDTSLFSGASWHPDWPGKYRDQVTPVGALWVNEGRVYGATGARVPKPAKAAADTFANALRKNGVRVTRVSGAKASRQAPEVAVVRSMPLDRIVEHLLMVSDNDASEVLARQVAVGSGRPGSFLEGRRAVQAQLQKLGVWDESTRIRDGSGLSRSNRVSARLLTRLLRLDMAGAHPELRAVATGLPVAGVEGSLRIRFYDKATRSARGLVRGKTGTLTGVHGLAGYVRSPDGALLAYAFLVNDAKDGAAARLWLDKVASAISTCGCR